MHGDIFDLVVTQARWLALLGDKAYDFAITVNRRVQRGCAALIGAPYWSLSKWAKLKVKNAVNYIGAFEQALSTEAARHKADGVICGHIHTAAMHDDYGLRYINCGDWVESCTAVGERMEAASRSSPGPRRCETRRQPPRWRSRRRHEREAPCSHSLAPFISAKAGTQNDKASERAAPGFTACAGSRTEVCS